MNIKDYNREDSNMNRKWKVKQIGGNIHLTAYFPCVILKMKWGEGEGVDLSRTFISLPLPEQILIHIAWYVLVVMPIYIHPQQQCYPSVQSVETLLLPSKKGRHPNEKHGSGVCNTYHVSYSYVDPPNWMCIIEINLYC